MLDDPDDDAMPHDLDALLMTLRQRLAMRDPTVWKRCNNRHCRRVRCCVSASVPCVSLRPAPPMTATEEADMVAALQSALRARMQGDGNE